MDPKQVKAWIDVVQGVLTVLFTLLAGLWAWVKLVLERGLLPPSQMDLTLRKLGSTEEATIFEIGIEILNKGSSALVVTDLRIRIRYLNQDDQVDLVQDPKRSSFGRVSFRRAHTITSNGLEDPNPTKRDEAQRVSLANGEFLVVPYDTFVQPGVNQNYTFATALPSTAKYILTRASFRYQLRASHGQLAILRLGRMMGLMQYSLNHIREPHTIEKSFNLLANSTPSGALE